jgi:hypothetical protein
MRHHFLPVVVMLIFVGCNGPTTQESATALSLEFAPPPGWIKAEGSAPAANHLPLPRLDSSGKTQERLIARYDRSGSGQPAWMRVSRAVSDPTRTLRKYVSAKTPGTGWKLKNEARELDFEGVQSYRVVFAGRWENRDYLNETVAIRRGEQVFVITASFPATDEQARAQVRESIANAIDPP